MIRSTGIVLVNFSPRYVRSDDALVVRFGYRVWYPEVQETSYDVDVRSARPKLPHLDVVTRRSVS